MQRKKAQMADGPSPEPLLTPDPGYPPQEVVTIYADGITSFTPGAEIVKFYFSRLDPNFVVSEPNKVVVTGQVIMPLAGFVTSVSFLQRVLSNLIDSGIITQEKIDQINAGRYKK
jgi:hypothetical protein